MLSMSTTELHPGQEFSNETNPTTKKDKLIGSWSQEFKAIISYMANLRPAWAR